MRALLVSIVVAPLLLAVPNAALAQTGDAQAGKTLWEGADTFCRQCHGGKGEGGFGPDLAGRHLTAAQFTRAVRQPWGIMPAYVDTQVSDKEIADLIAYFGTLPAVAEPAPWRVPLPANAPHGQELAIATLGCSQCHGPVLANPRADAGGVNADFEWFKRLVYSHTTEMAPLWMAFEERPVRMRMGNYSRARLPESTLLEIWNWANDIGLRARIAGELSAPARAANGVTYTLNVANTGIAGKGLAAEDLTIALVVPAGATVVSTTGAGYQGVKMDAQAKANVATWQLPRLAAKDKQTYTITLSSAATPQDNVRGSIRWMKPAVKPGPADQANIPPAPLQPATN